MEGGDETGMSEVADMLVEQNTLFQRLMSYSNGAIRRAVCFFVLRNDETSLLCVGVSHSNAFFLLPHHP